MIPPSDFSLAYARFLPPIAAKCRRLLGHSAAAEDVVQETFVRLWRSDLEGDPRTIMAWLYRTCTRLAIDVMRERRRVDPREPTDAAPCGVDLAACAAARSAIVALVGAVPEQELTVAVLVRLDGLAQPEAASVLGISERTVRRALDRFDRRTCSMREELSE